MARPGRQGAGLLEQTVQADVMRVHQKNRNHSGLTLQIPGPKDHMRPILTYVEDC